jgi:glycosyltransferase involved in cell wall biosynthesis
MVNEKEKEKEKGVLIITPFFPPNVGGVETYAEVLTYGLSKSGYTAYVHTYSPITTENVEWKSQEERHPNIFVKRYRWFGWNLFNRLEKMPLLEFIYVMPYLFLRVFLWMITNNRKVYVVHAFGLNAALIGVVLKKVFNKRLVVTIHAVYERPADSFFAKLTAQVLNQVDKVLTLSGAATRELTTFGVNTSKLSRFRHWINLETFKPRDKKNMRKQIGIEDKFTILFVGRLIPKKGIRELCEVAKILQQVNFVFIGHGSEQKYLEVISETQRNVKYLGMIPNKEVYKYYNCADVFCIPSQYEEGFGRVIMEAVASGLPVVGAAKGGIPEALDTSVSILVDPIVENLKEAILKLYTEVPLLESMVSNCRRYAEEHFSERNLSLITKNYEAAPQD